MIDNDDVFDALADTHRRQLLVELVTHNPTHVPKLSGVTKELADANGNLLEEYLSGSREIAGVDEELLRLNHVHLPKLAEYGFVEWDREATVVTRGPRFDEMRLLLELLDDHRRDRPTKDVVPVRK